MQRNDTQQTPQRMAQARSALRQHARCKARLALLDKRIAQAAMAGAPRPLRAATWQERPSGAQPDAETSVRRVLRLMAEKDALMARVCAVEDALEDIRFDEMAYRMLEAYYLRDESAVALAAQWGYSTRQFYRKLAGAVLLFAQYLDFAPFA
nr:hypothetical protein [Maliibacterium massiliense]